MNSFYYNILNWRMPRGNFVNCQAENIFNAIIPTFEDPMNLSGWVKKEKGNWGSANPDTIGVYDTSMVYEEDKKFVIYTKTYPSGIIGKDWDGNDVEPRYYLLGEITSDYFVNIGQSVSVLCTVEPQIGCCPAIWLFPTHRDANDEIFYQTYYREIDLLESYPEKAKDLYHILQTFHGGTSENRKMFNTSFHKECSFARKILFTLDLHSHKFVLKINGITTGIYKPSKNEEWRKMNIILSTAVTKERNPYFDVDMIEEKKLNQLTVHGIKISNL